jgi:DNA-binding NarL/FixJ family response regulator
MGREVGRIKVLIIDQQVLFRAGVRQALSNEPAFDITDCDPTQDPLPVIETNLPDVVLLGANLATRSMLELGRNIVRYSPTTKVILLSPDPNDKELFEIVKTAAVACLTKNTTAEELVGTIRRACGSEYPVNERFATRPTVVRPAVEQFQDAASAGKTKDSTTMPLTHRETQILNYIATGYSNKLIGHVLGISEQTIKNHVSAILYKLGASCRAHAAVLAIQKGWLSTERTHDDMVAVY